MSTSVVSYFRISNELSHSSMIVEFFWFFVSFLTLTIAVIKLIKIGTVHEIKDYNEKPQPKPSLPVNDPQQDGMKEPQLGNDVNGINIDINNNNSDQQSQQPQENAAPHINAAAIEEKTISTLPPTGQGFITTFSDICDLMVGKHLVIFVIFVYLINHFGSYIYTAIVVFFCIIQLLLFNYFKIFERLQNMDAQKYSELSYHIWIITLFIAYFANSQYYQDPM